LTAKDYGPGVAGTATRAIQDCKHAANTTTGRHTPEKTESFAFTLRGWRSHRSGRLRGYAEIQLGCGLIIGSVPVFLGDDGIGRGLLPEHPRVAGGQVVIDQGKVAYASDVYWPNAGLARAWGKAVGVLVRSEYPEDFAQ
jgi:hypothetical protein